MVDVNLEADLKKPKEEDLSLAIQSLDNILSPLLDENDKPKPGQKFTEELEKQYMHFLGLIRKVSGPKSEKVNHYTLKLIDLWQMTK